MENRRKEHLYPVSPDAAGARPAEPGGTGGDCSASGCFDQKAREGIKILKRARGVNSLNDLPLNLRRQLDELIE